MTIKRILVGVDFGELSEHALRWSVQLAKDLGGAEILALHAYELPVYGFPEGALIASADVATRLASGAQAALDALVAAHAKDPVSVRGILREGVPWEEITAVAEQEKADLIVVGTHARKGMRRLLLGSVAERVVRTATRPVVTLHAGE